MRITIDITDEAYSIANSIAREYKRSLGSVVSEFITMAEVGPSTQEQLVVGSGFPMFRCVRQVSSAEVADLGVEV